MEDSFLPRELKKKEMQKMRSKMTRWLDFCATRKSLFLSMAQKKRKKEKDEKREKRRAEKMGRDHANPLSRLTRGEEEEEKVEEEEEKVQGNRRQFLNMALTLMGYNEIWLKSNNTIGLSMHRVIHYIKSILMFSCSYQVFFPSLEHTLSNAD